MEHASLPDADNDVSKNNSRPSAAICAAVCGDICTVVCAASAGCAAAAGCSACVEHVHSQSITTLVIAAADVSEWNMACPTKSREAANRARA